MSKPLEPWLIKIMHERAVEYGERLGQAALREMAMPRWCNQDVHDAWGKEFQKIADEIRKSNPEMSHDNDGRFFMWAKICFWACLVMTIGMLLIGTIFGDNP